MPVQILNRPDINATKQDKNRGRRSHFLKIVFYVEA